jgi:hypothetical protein
VRIKSELKILRIREAVSVMRKKFFARFVIEGLQIEVDHATLSLWSVWMREEGQMSSLLWAFFIQPPLSPSPTPTDLHSLNFKKKEGTNKYMSFSYAQFLFIRSVRQFQSHNMTKRNNNNNNNNNNLKIHITTKKIINNEHKFWAKELSNRFFNQ